VVFGKTGKNVPVLLTINIRMIDPLGAKAKNYFILGVIAETLNMPSEAATNFLKHCLLLMIWL